MGWKYEVNAWVVDGPMSGEYRYEQVYTGPSLWRAVLAMRKAKKTSGCVKLEWR